MRSSSPLARAIAILLPLVVLADVLVGCGQTGAGTTQNTTPAVTSVPPAWKLVWNGHYSTHIQPIFDQHCVSCHGPTRTDAQLTLTSYAEVMKGGKDGPVVMPGNPAISVLISSVNGTAAGSSRMPPTGPRLSDTEVQNLTIWIDAGAPSD
jgi:mono/diheme cytochrome c family protein